MKFRVIDAEKANVPVHRACALLGVSVSGFYAWKGRAPSRRQNEDLVLLAHIRSHFEISRETYGSPRMTAELNESGIAVGRHRIARLMRDNGLKALQKRRFRQTTDSDHKGPVAPNALEQDFAASGPPMGIIHHSDRGSQYCAEAYQKLLTNHGFVLSMSGKGNCYDNAMVETVFKTLKSELV